MAFSSDFVERVRQAVDIVALIDSYVPLKRAGANYKALSPFTEEKTPSFYVHPQKQIFKCFSSGHGGDVFKFVMMYENMDFPSSVRMLAEKYNIPIPEMTYDKDYQESKALKQRLISIQTQLAQHWQKVLLKDPRATLARDYLKKRKIPSAWVESFGIGYAPFVWDDTVEWAKKNKISEKDLLQIGVVIKKSNGQIYDRFRGRVMFPIYNDMGEVVAFSGRIVEGDDGKTGKYVNSPETPVFVKSRVMYGLNWAKRPIIDQDQVIICEGQIDVLRAHAAGIKNVVAPLGTAFTPEHAKLLKRCTNHFTLCLDADRAGQQAAERFRSVLMEKKENTYSLMHLDVTIDVIELPEGDDPDSLISNHGVDAFKRLIDERISYLDFYIRHLRKKYDEASPNGKRNIVEAVTEFLAQVPNLITREALIIQGAEQLRLTEATLKHEVEGVLSKKQRSQRPEFERNNKTEKTQAPLKEFKPHALIQDLLQLALSDEKMIPLIQQKINEEWTGHLSGSEILWQIVDLFNHDEWTGIGGFLHRTDENVQQYLTFLDVERLEKFSSTEKETVLVKISKLVSVEFIQQEIALLNQKVKKQPLSEAELAHLAKLHKELAQSKKAKV